MMWLSKPETLPLDSGISSVVVRFGSTSSESFFSHFLLVTLPYVSSTATVTHKTLAWRLAVLTDA